MKKVSLTVDVKNSVVSNIILPYKDLCAALIEKFGIKQTVKWDSVLPYQQQQSIFGGEILRLIADHPTLATQKEIRPISLIKGEGSQLLFFFVQLKDEKLPKAIIERVTRRFIGGASVDRHIIWFFGNKNADTLKIVVSGKEGKRIRLKTLSLEAGQWFKTYDFILGEVERKFNTDGLFQSFKEPSGLWKAIWEAFDISIVNKKFYAEIKAVFDALIKEELAKCKGILTNNEDKVQFAIRLIGRIIFCWFLKRKAIIKGDVLSAKAVDSKADYYHEILEPLFFDVFNTPVRDRKKNLPDVFKDYPFLNGGLFEPQPHDYKDNWALHISSKWFSNFFSNTLEKYNFTVDENSSESSEIAIDPEMLGRIFENLLAEQNPETGQSARKSTGSYYTPREIVDYMVEESLIAYLKSCHSCESRNPEKTLEELDSRLHGNDKIIDNAIEDFVHTTTLPEDLKSYSKELLNYLNTIKILDPACGSGAFPISMLQKLVKLKHSIDDKTKIYDFKLKTIENSIYGIDIQPMATELSRLRCWLSLVVDEDSKDIKPLPNLDFKFVTANSLIDLGYDELVHKAGTGEILPLYLTDFFKKMNELRAVRQKYFDLTVNQKEKDKLKNEFTAIKNDLFKMSLELIKHKFLDVEFANKINHWDPFDDSEPAPFFSPEWMFGVTSNSPLSKGGTGGCEGGFDVVIANPPYIRQEDLKPIKALLQKQGYEVYNSTSDIYTYFYEKGWQILNNAGHLTFITSNKWMRAKYGEKLRKFFKDKTALKQIIDFGGHKVFESATVDTNILLFQKFPLKKGGEGVVRHSCESGNPVKILTIKSDFNHNTDLAEHFNQNAITMNQQALDEKCFTFGDDAVMQLKKKVEQAGTPLKDWGVNIYRGVTTGFNEAFIIDNETKERLCKEDPKSIEVLKPILRGRDIQRYSYNWMNLWLLYIPWHFPLHKDNSIQGSSKKAEESFKKQFPAIYGHLLKYKDQLLDRNKDETGIRYEWYSLQRCAATYYPEFEKEKIFVSEFGYEFCGAYDVKQKYCQDTAHIIIGTKYHLAVLNSKVIHFYIGTIATGLGKKGIRFKPQFIEQLPIPKISEQAQQPFITIVDQILTAKQQPPLSPFVKGELPNADTSALEREIDKMVYELYGLTPEEIEIVEGKDEG